VAPHLPDFGDGLVNHAFSLRRSPDRCCYSGPPASKATCPSPAYWGYELPRHLLLPPLWRGSRTSACGLSGGQDGHGLPAGGVAIRRPGRPVRGGCEYRRRPPRLWRRVAATLRRGPSSSVGRTRQRLW
jgi:hypothetical protein